jgi:integrase/recombinase XerC
MISASSAIPLYLDALRIAKKSPNTIRTYTQALRHFSRIIGKRDELSEENYKRFLRVTAEDFDLSPSAQSTYRVAICRLYEYHAPGVPVKLITDQYGMKKGKRLIRYNEDGVDRLVSFAETLRGDLLALRDRAFILTLADTGLRISEACNLIRSDIDFERARAVILGKGDKEGLILFSPRALSSIREYLSARAEIDGKTGRPLGSLPVFARHDRGAGKKIKPVGSRAMSGAFDGRTREAGIDPESEDESGAVTPHKLRHRFVTQILRETGNIKKAQVLARHEDIGTTQRYSHLSETEIEETYREVFYK